VAAIHSEEIENMPMIMDVGMHLGEDTAFYLSKGFRVVAIEAHPEFVSKNRREFEQFMKDGLLEIVPCAIAEAKGVIPFHIFADKSDWGTIDRDYAQRNILRGASHQIVEVPCVTFQSVLEQFGVPYYLKIDIEGSDLLCVRALHGFAERPKHVSLELALLEMDKTFEALSHLFSLGYRRFKIVNQALNHKQRCPNPPREGKYVDAKFNQQMSGPFGEEAAGEWMGVEQTFLKCRRILKAQANFSPEGRFHYLRGIHNNLMRRLGAEPLGWYDIHATTSESTQR
jgi:FkbM family methyltransferase